VLEQEVGPAIERVPLRPQQRDGTAETLLDINFSTVSISLAVASL
jgi:hypothetical protein